MRTTREQRDFVFARAQKAINEKCDKRLDEILKKKDHEFEEAEKHIQRALAKEEVLREKIKALRQATKKELAFLFNLEEKEWTGWDSYYGESGAYKRFLDKHKEQRLAAAREQIGYKEAFEQLEAFKLQIVLSDAEGLQHALEQFIANLKV